MTRITEDQEHEIIELYQAGLSGVDLADIYKVSKVTIYRKLDRHGIERRDEWAGLNVEQDEDIRCVRCGKPYSKKEFYPSDKYWCKECRKEWNREYMRAHPQSKSFDKYYQENYGITEDDYWNMAVEQDMRCAICGEAMYQNRFCVDHDHETGEVRGILCHKCNLALGYFLDNPETIQNAVDYLNRFK